MTRHNRREIERDLEDLRTDHDTGDVEGWVREYIDKRSVEMVFCVQYVDEEGNVTTQIGSNESEGDGVCIGTDAPWRYYADPGDIPAWITPERDLPVRL
jgi:hypothetical protein